MYVCSHRNNPPEIGDGWLADILGIVTSISNGYDCKRRKAG